MRGPLIAVLQIWTVRPGRRYCDHRSQLLGWPKRWCVTHWLATVLIRTAGVVEVAHRLASACETLETAAKAVPDGVSFLAGKGVPIAVDHSGNITMPCRPSGMKRAAPLAHSSI